ncbi:hypothetical protein PVK06_027223 [Gossypium arboreum]|uniref:Uncharacterized protein n=1 Tax=Gossypium arboreum TaxID=29729 RepID=A0ABR0NZQ4_GOSAR|nr:hypothetical protein PVK06_027223 [Gossypium arboreum]
MEALLKEYIAMNDVVIQSQAISLRALENQMGQISSALSLRQQGELSSNIENSRSQGKEHCKAITLRSGIQLLGVVNDAVLEEDSSDVTCKANSKPVVEYSTIEKSKQKNVEAKLAIVANKNAMAKQLQQCANIDEDCHDIEIIDTTVKEELA